MDFLSHRSIVSYGNCILNARSPLDEFLFVSYTSNNTAKIGRAFLWQRMKPLRQV